MSSSSTNFDAIGPDLYSYYNEVRKTEETKFNAKTVYADSDEANNTLSFQDMLMLMVTQLQNQTIDNTADTNDMMNQIIQMTVMQAITKMSTQVDDLTEANILSYSASLVGQTVTVPIYDSKGNIVSEKVGEVTATGTYNGQRVIFMGDEYYPINQIMAVGKLPEKKPATGETDKGDETDKGEGVDGTDGSQGTDVPSTDDTEDTGNDSGMDVAGTTVPKALG